MAPPKPVIKQLPYHPHAPKAGKVEQLPYKPGKVDLPNAIDEYLAGRGSPMAGLGASFVHAGQRYGVDPRLLVGIGVIESSAGKNERIPYNFANWGVHTGKGYSSHEEAIDDLARGLRKGYISEGRTNPYKIVEKYAPGSDGNNTRVWADTVSQVMKTLGGNPGSVARKPSRAPGAVRATASVPAPRPRTPGMSTFEMKGGVDAMALARSILSGMDAGKALEESTTPYQLIEHVPKLPPVIAASKAAKYGGTIVDAGTAPGPTDAVSRAIAIAKQQIGKPYVFGAASPKAGFDCSGLIDYAFTAAGIATPGRLTTGPMAKMGKAVPWQNIQPGDWVVRDSGGEGHVVMYVGNGQVIAAPHTGEVVQYQPLGRFSSDSRFHVRRWHG